MNWQSELKLSDLDPAQALEVTCRVCGHSRYEKPAQLIEYYGLHFAYIDEAAAMLVCHRRGCRGKVRLAIAPDAETEGFVGGLA